MELSVARLARRALHQMCSQDQKNLALPVQGAVEPHMAVDSLALEPELAWQATLEVLPSAIRSQLATPAGWPAWMERLGPTGWLVHAVGEFPQRLAMESVLEGDPIAPVLADTPPLPQGKHPADHLLAGALLRQAGQYAAASARLDQVTLTDWADCLTNERAALAWQQGDFAAAEKLWATCVAVPGILYNRALARHAAGDKNQALELFNKAATAWPENSPWHHLARVCALVSG